MPAKPKTFPEGLARLLRNRKIPVPEGLLEAPEEAYAGQGPEFVESLAKLDNDQLSARAEKVATYASRQTERAKRAWDSSPLIAELRRRGLKVPRRPKRVVALAFSVKKPLSKWSEKELLEAASEWSRRGR